MGFKKFKKKKIGRYVTFSSALVFFVCERDKGDTSYRDLLE